MNIVARIIFSFFFTGYFTLLWFGIMECDTCSQIIINTNDGDEVLRYARVETMTKVLIALLTLIFLYSISVWMEICI